MEEWKLETGSYSDSGFAGLTVGDTVLPENVGSAAPGSGGSSSGSDSADPGSSSSGSSGNWEDGGRSGSSGSHSSSGGSSVGSGSTFIELTDEDEQTVITTGRTPESEIVEITIFDNFQEPVMAVPVTAASLPKGETAGNPGLLAIPAILLAAAVAIGFLLRSRGRRNST